MQMMNQQTLNLNQLPTLESSNQLQPPPAPVVPPIALPNPINPLQNPPNPANLPFDAQNVQHVVNSWRNFTRSTRDCFNWLYNLIGVLALLMVPVSTYAGHQQNCSSYHHYFLIFWAIMFIKTGCRLQLQMPCFNLITFIWANLYLLEWDRLETSVKINMLLIVAYSLEYYFAVLFCGCFCACCFCCCAIVLYSVIRQTITAREIMRESAENKQRARERLRNIEVDEETECSICLEKGLDCELPCRHQFHRKCIENWIEFKPSCPACRTNI